MDTLGDAYEIRNMPLEASVTVAYAADMKAQLLPILLRSGVREDRGGIPRMTGDGRHIDV